MQNKVIRLDPAVFRGMGTLSLQPAHLHPSLWRLDANGMNAVASLPGEVWEWVQGRWVSRGNPLRREVMP